MSCLIKPRIEQYLASKPYCSNDKTASLIRQKRFAIHYEYIQLNNPIQCAWLIFDCDHQDTLLWERLSLPTPNYIAISPKSGHFHIGYAISPVYTSENSRAKPLEYLSAIQRTYTRLLQADVRYSGLMAKNPLHPLWKCWVMHDKQYDLAELHEAVGELDRRPHKSEQNYTLIGLERNCELFDALRYHAYAHIKIARESSASYWYDYILLTAESINEGFLQCNATPLPFNEYKHIAKSVAKWTYQRRDTIQCKERKLALDESQPLATRQTIGALHSHQVRKDDTVKRITKAVETLKEQGFKVTQKAVCEASGLHRNTVAKHKDLLANLK